MKTVKIMTQYYKHHINNIIYLYFFRYKLHFYTILIILSAITAQTNEIFSTTADSIIKFENSTNENIQIKLPTEDEDNLLNLSFLNVVQTRLRKLKDNKKKNKAKNSLRRAVQNAARQGLQEMLKFYEEKQATFYRSENVLDVNDPGAKLSAFSASVEEDGNENREKAAMATLITAKKLKQR